MRTTYSYKFLKMLKSKLGMMLIIISVKLSSSQIYPELSCGSEYKPDNCENATIDTLMTVEDYARCAPAKLDPLFREYVWGGAGRQMTLKGNYLAYKNIYLRKRILKESSNANTITTLLGRTVKQPISISPTAAYDLVHEEGNSGLAKAAHNMGSIDVLSAHSSTSLEKVAESVPDTNWLWIQIFLFPDRSETVQLVRRAEKSGYKAIVVTLDAAIDTDIPCNALSRGVHGSLAKKGLPNLIHPNGTYFNRHLTINDVYWLKTLTRLPIVAKGVMTGEDALHLANAGVSAIWVSNHGGRQLDGSLPTIDALPEIVDVLKAYPHIEVYIDGGIYNGYDVCKAIGRGARTVFIGRATVWGLTMGGQKGVEKVLSILQKEFLECMVHMGFNNPEEMRKARNSVIPLRPNFNCYHV